MAETAANPWGGPAPSADSSSWLDAPVEPDAPSFDIMHPFQETLIPFDAWVEQGLEWLVSNFRPVFQAVRWPVDAVSQAPSPPVITSRLARAVGMCACGFHSASPTPAAACGPIRDRAR